jgi:hypothetical protein
MTNAWKTLFKLLPGNIFDPSFVFYRVPLWQGIIPRLSPCAIPSAESALPSVLLIRGRVIPWSAGK